MESTAFYLGLWIALLVSIAIAVLLPLLMSGERFRVAEEKAHARRLTDARMKARLLRFNL